VVSLATETPGITMPRFEQSVSPLDRNVLALTLQGRQIILSMNGQALATATDSTFSRGAGGLAEQWNLVLFDNFTVEPPSADAAASASSPFGGETGASAGSVYRI